MSQKALIVLSYYSQGNWCKNCSHGDTSMKLAMNVHKDQLYKYKTGAIKISVLHSNGCEAKHFP